MLNLREVQAFVAVIETGGFREAGDRLALSQPTVSQQVRRLEEALGAQLVIRDRALGCVPTEIGGRFLPHARGLLRATSRAVAAVSGRGLSVGASSNIGVYLLPPIAKRFVDERHQIPDIVIGTNPEIANRLETGELDLAVMEWWDGRRGFKAETWRREPLVFIVPPGHPWTELAAVPHRALFDAPWIGGEPGTGTGRLIRKAFGPDADRLHVALTLGSTEAVKAAVEAGLGVSLVTLSSVQNELRDGSLQAVPVEGTVPLHKELVVVLPEDTPTTAPAVTFAALLLSCPSGVECG